jgi:hypothetical protein
MVTLPSVSMCAMMDQGMFGPSDGMNMGNEPPVAVLWGGREWNPSSIVVRINDPMCTSSLMQSFLHLDVSQS